MRAPPGYESLPVGDAELVGVSSLVPALREALRAGTFLRYAAGHPAARTFRGRGPVYAVPLPDGETRVVVRRSRHGGLFAPITGERFLAPTRAPKELDIALRLRRLGVATPEVVAYALYPAGPLLRRADVLTREVPDARDLVAAVSAAESDEERGRAWDAAYALIGRLRLAGVRHPDLNLKNVLLRRDEHGTLEGVLLDVDRVRFGAPNAVPDWLANLSRFHRSAVKWHERAGLPLPPDLKIADVEARPFWSRG